jgi:hypothetical protein
MAEITCAQCRNPIDDDEALLCHFCGGSLSRPSNGALGALRSGSLKWVLIAVALLIIAAMVLSAF